jgi:hypothetical protein
LGIYGKGSTDGDLRMGIYGSSSSVRSVNVVVRRFLNLGDCSFCAV